MYILKQTKKENNTVIKTENTLLGNRYVVLYFFPENKQYSDIREQHFVFNLGLNTLDVQHYQNPFILNEDGSKIIYLEDFHNHQIINDENGVLIEDLSNYVGQLLNSSDEKTSKFMETQSRIIQQTYDEKMAEKMTENNNIIVDDISAAAIPEEDILKRPTNYSLHQIFERLKSGRKRQDQLLLQDLIEIVDKKEPFVILTTQEYDNYNALVTLLIEKHLGTFKEANVNGFFKEQQLENRGYSSRATLGQI